MQYKWIVVLFDQTHTHCGSQYSPALPISLNLLTALMDAFIKEHKDCLPSNNESSHGRAIGSKLITCPR